MPVTTLRPVSPSTAVSGHGDVSGAASVHAALSDDSDTSFVLQIGPSGSQFGFAQTTVGWAAVPADAFVRRLRIGMRARRNLTATQAQVARMTAFVVDALQSGVRGVVVAVNRQSAEWETIWSSWQETTAVGDPWPPRGDWSPFLVMAKNMGDTAINVAESYVDMDWDVTPDTPVLSMPDEPNLAAVESPQPTLRVEYSHPHDTPGRLLQIRVFDRETTDHPEFGDPFEHPLPEVVWSYNLTIGGGGFTEIERDLGSVSQQVWLENHTDYRVYVRVFAEWGSAGDNPLAADNQLDFTTDYPASAQPEPLLITAEHGVAAVSMEITTDPTDANPPEWYVVEYRDDESEVWQTVRGGARLEVGDQPSWYWAEIWDHEAQAGVQRTYRVRGFRTVVGSDIPSDPRLGTATLTPSRHWLRNPLHPDDSFTVDQISQSGDVTRRAYPHQLIGRPLPVVLHDVTAGEVQSLTVRARGHDQWQQCTRLARSTDTWLISTPWEHRYVQLITAGWQQEHPDPIEVRTMHLQVVEVDRPPAEDT